LNPPSGTTARMTSTCVAKCFGITRHTQQACHLLSSDKVRRSSPASRRTLWLFWSSSVLSLTDYRGSLAVFWVAAVRQQWPRRERRRSRERRCRWRLFCDRILTWPPINHDTRHIPFIARRCQFAPLLYVNNLFQVVIELRLHHRVLDPLCELFEVTKGMFNGYETKLVFVKVILEL
jgi:hypothetical protein